ncbi:helix-turn-helix domain-containing protein [Blastococcus litoris]
MLPDAHRSLTDASELLGFASPGALSRWFRQRFGVSPTQWRTSSRSAPL